MTLHAALTHRTAYHYDRVIGMGPQVIRLRPAPHCRTPILSYSLTIEPAQHFINWQQDPFANFCARVVIPEKTDRFIVTVDLVADMAVINPFDFFLEERAREWPFAYEGELKADLRPYLEPLPAGPLLSEFLAGIRPGKTSTIDFLCDMNAKVKEAVSYCIRMEPGIQTTEETLAKRSGSCRDSGWLLVQVLRHIGFAARFVSGYLIQLRPDVKPLDGPAGASTDFTDLHAWAEVYVPGAGWIGLDPTSGLLAGEGHIPLAATPQPSSAAPISGGHERAEVTFSVDMSVKRLRETPRVTLPYTEDQWKAILAAGDAVDVRLDKGDVRLSMGGEPTFVSLDDQESAEWKTAAVGPTKRRYADELVRGLQRRFAPGGLLHYGQGKWYPGEPLPRWSFAIYWRRDGEPLWTDPELIARETQAHAATISNAERFMGSLCERLGLPADSALPAYEDGAYYALVERQLPINASPGDSDLGDAAERARLVRVFEQGLDGPASYVLPLQVWHSPDVGRRWVSERWRIRREKLFLVPGDSPAGLRLPMASLAVVPAADYPHVLPLDPLGEPGPLPERDDIGGPPRAVTLKAPPPPPVSGPSETYGSVRTALAVEPRDGHLCVFLPPLTDALDFAALVAAIEEAARDVAIPVHVEGYAPPSDPRINVIKVTPDPGVIEVNIHPARDWKELVSITTGIYEEAREARLGTEKFLVDGRHVGTGGGNHIVMGGMTPVDSPFLRRADVLASIVTYWQNHPSLSYLFSGLFIGPTSQAPRLDEARHESLYELEIALAQIPDPAEASLPLWLVDRLFRHLLTDVTGNTHRAEICIDKLYSPDGPTGRLGLVEFRSFEMPPHPRMMRRSATVDARHRCEVLGCALPRQADPLGNGAAGSLHAPAFRVGGFCRRHRRSQERRPAARARMVPPPLRVPLPAHRRHRGRRVEARASPGARALARAGRGRHRGRHGALRRCLARAHRGARLRRHGRPLRRHLQWPRDSLGADRHRRRGGRGRALPRLAAGFRPAPDDRAARAAHIRHCGYLERPLGRRLPLPRLAPGRAQFRGGADQRLRGPGAAIGPLRPQWPQRRQPVAGTGKGQSRVPLDARSAALSTPARGMMVTAGLIRFSKCLPALVRSSAPAYFERRNLTPDVSMRDLRRTTP